MNCNSCLCRTCLHLYNGVICMAKGYEEAWTVCNQCYSEFPIRKCHDYEYDWSYDYKEEEKVQKIRRNRVWD